MVESGVGYCGIVVVGCGVYLVCLWVVIFFMNLIC